jgi:type III restriction enzyme
VIVDEPQSVDGGLSGAGKSALDAMNPLCTLRYSATHADKHHMVFRLDAVDAYDRRLVKQIEVASLEKLDAHNKAYVRFVSSKSVRSRITARIEIDRQVSNQVRRDELDVEDGQDLGELTGRAVYEGYRIGEIRAGKALQMVELRRPGGEDFLKPGEVVGDVDADGIVRLMIARTIREHLEKEKRLAPLKVKVLSLFFVGQVGHLYQLPEWHRLNA